MEIENKSSMVQATPIRALRPALFYSIVILVFLSDQFSKAWAKNTLIEGQEKPILGQAFLLSLTHNTGGAWGWLPTGNMIFIVFAAFAVVALLFAYHRMARVDLLIGAAFALALGGALGNLLDRIRYGHVVDFFYAKIIHWPIFNVADSAISLGIALLLVHFVRSAREEARHTTVRSPEEAVPSATD